MANEEGDLSDDLTVPARSVEEVGEAQLIYRQGLAFGISTEKNVTVTDSAVFGIAAGHDLNLTDSGAVSVAIGHDLDLTDGGAVFLRVGGSAEITQGGAAAAICDAVNARDSSFGILISRNASLEEGNKVNVYLGTKQALVFGVAFGAAFGSIFALLRWLLRKRT